jgi:hypothetical protein
LSPLDKGIIQKWFFNKHGNFLGIYYFSSVNKKKFAIFFLGIFSQNFNITELKKKKSWSNFVGKNLKGVGMLEKSLWMGKEKGKRAEEG